MPPPYPLELYRLLHRGNPGDVDRYAEVLAGHKTVLELGSGDGRVALELAKRGFDMTGIEVCEEYLGAAEEQARRAGVDARFVAGDMTGFDLGRTFDAVIAPFNTLYCERNAEDCLLAAARHLRVGGLLAFDVYDVEDFHEMVHDDEDVFETLGTFEMDGEPLEVAERAAWNKSAQILEVQYRYRWRQPRREVTCGITHHYRTQSQFRDLLERAGFEVRILELLFEPSDDGGASALFVAELVAEAAES